MANSMDAQTGTEPGSIERSSHSDSAGDHPEETLIEELDRRQNSVLEELDDLDARIQDLVRQCRDVRSDAA